MTLFAGTSGYGYRGWVGRFYPPKTRSADFLRHYARRLTSVEINHTFRRFPKPHLAARWAETTPRSFRFAVKAHLSITHRKKLDGVEESIADFIAALSPLEKRLGPVLFGCPPWLERDDRRLERFLRALPADGQYALEFRHPSWNCREVRAACTDLDVAIAAAPTDLETRLEVPVTADFAYLRLRRDPPWSDTEQRNIVRTILDLEPRVGSLYLYAKHDDAGRAPGAVQAILDRVGRGNATG